MCPTGPSRSDDFAETDLSTQITQMTLSEVETTADPRKTASSSHGFKGQGLELLAAANIGPTPDTTKHDLDRVRWEYDVYAAPYVPLAFREVNLEYAHSTAITSSRHEIDYKRYTESFCGTDFLPPDTIISDRGQVTSTIHKALSAQNYYDYFARLLRLECVAKENENSGHSLYRVPLRKGPTHDGETLWLLSIPGLREDNPFVEKGDVLLLRQLWVDNARNPIAMPFASINGQASYEYERLWTGVQYRASIFSVNRAQEVVYLRVNGLSFLHLAQFVVPMTVNVVFPLRQKVVPNLLRALTVISTQLTRSQDTSKYGVDTSENTQILDDDCHDPDKNISSAALLHFAPNGHDWKDDWLSRILFPMEFHGLIQRTLRSIPHGEFFDDAINYEQAHAVKSVCRNEYGILPYLISGPPGTGKTKTLVEMALQLLKTTEVAHILICAPSEAAADTLAIRLKQYMRHQQLLRLHRPNRADNEVPGELAGYCYMEYSMFYLPPFRQLMKYNVVVTSCQDASILAEARLTNSDLCTIKRNTLSAFQPEVEVRNPALHWGALLVDEAAQATELDILPALSVVCPPPDFPKDMLQPRFVMAGDENQLGPRTASRNPEYTASLFARLFDRPLYRNHPLSRFNMKPTSGPPVLKKSMLPIISPAFTNLIRNYRSHPAILSIPSSLFYNDSLLPEVAIPDTPLQRSIFWQGRKWPVLFLPHDKADEIERDGGGWYNISEARLACSIAQQLILACGVKQADICIMSPFAAQVKYLRGHIRGPMYGGGSGLWDVNIGPLEAFQGLENRVVIICTTRTRERFVAEDRNRGFGIVHDKRKMNVALTRAKEALFVIGSPSVLVKDEHWREWLAFCWRNGLVHDPKGLWRGDQEGFGGEKIGVLERALIAKEGSGIGGNNKVLGRAVAMQLHFGGESWEDSLRAALGQV